MYIYIYHEKAVLSLFLLLPRNGTQTLKETGGAAGRAEQWFSNFAALPRVRTRERVSKTSDTQDMLGCGGEDGSLNQSAG